MSNDELMNLEFRFYCIASVYPVQLRARIWCARLKENDFLGLEPGAFSRPTKRFNGLF